jgi:hypothetical protein
MFIFSLFFMPETLFDRPDDDATDASLVEQEKEHIDELEDVSTTGDVYHPPPMEFSTYLRRMWFWDLDRPPSRQMKATDFVIKPLSMLKYPSVTFPALY